MSKNNLSRLSILTETVRDLRRSKTEKQFALSEIRKIERATGVDHFPGYNVRSPSEFERLSQEASA